MAKVAIFALEGVLVDTLLPSVEKASELVFKFYGVPREKTRTRLMREWGVPLFVLLEEMFPFQTYRNLRVAMVYENWKNIAFPGLSVSENIKNALYELKEKGAVLAVSSNDPLRFTEKVVEGCPFDYILVWDGVFSREIHFKLLEERTRIPRSQFLFIGSFPKDEEVVRKYGIEFLKTSVERLTEDLRAVTELVR